MARPSSTSPRKPLRAPAATDLIARRTMEANRRVDTGPERLLRSALHRRGLRFRKDWKIRVDNRSVRPDIVFGPKRVAVFVDGCYWHRCPEHATHPRSNATFWEDKFRRTGERDMADDAALAAGGWAVVRVWEHEAPEDAAERIAAVLCSR